MKIAEGKIAVFAGTTEGRVLASRLAGSQVAADVFVATEYGKEEIPKAENLQVHDGRVDEIQMEKLFQEKKYDLILDATHPFAVVVTANIREAAEKTGTPLLRILRDKNGERTNVFTSENGPRTFEDDNQKKKNTKTDMEMPGESAWTETEGISDGSDCRIITVENIQAAVDFLKTTEGPVFVTTGSKELSAFLALPDWETRVYARVLSMPEVVKTCADMGFLRQPSDRNAGALCGRLKCCNDESGPCEVDGDEGVREGGRIRGKGQCGEKSRCRSCRDRKTGGRRNLVRRRNCLSGGAFCSGKVS